MCSSLPGPTDKIPLIGKGFAPTVSNNRRQGGSQVIGALKGANLALAFLLELVALVAFAFWAAATA